MPPMRAKVTQPLDRKQFIDYVTGRYGKDREVANRLFDISLANPLKNEPCDGGYFSCTPVGGPGSRAQYVMITDNSGPGGKNYSPGSRGALPSTAPVHYTSSVTKTRPTREITMPPRGRKPAAVAEAEPEVEATVETEDNGEKDYTAYATKAPTAAMQDFHDWLVNVGASPEFGTQKEKEAFRHGVRLGGTLRMEFQKSDFNRANRAARRAEREAAAAAEPAAEEVVTETEAAPPKATRGRPKAAAAPKRGRGKPVATGAQPF